MTGTKRDETSDRAVSPVIGVILMVAITVILAAVIGVFVLGLGDAVQETPPNVQMDTEWDGDNVTITHASGDQIDPSTLTLTGPDNSVNFTDGNWSSTWSDPITAGSSNEINVTTENIGTGSYRIVWQSGGTSSTIKTFEHPDA